MHCWSCIKWTWHGMKVFFFFNVPNNWPQLKMFLGILLTPHTQLCFCLYLCTKNSNNIHSICHVNLKCNTAVGSISQNIDKLVGYYKSLWLALTVLECPKVHCTVTLIWASNLIPFTGMQNLRSLQKIELNCLLYWENIIIIRRKKTKPVGS